MAWMILPLRRYAVFSGRSRRKEYWMFVLFTLIVSTVLSLLDGVLGLGGQIGDYMQRGPGSYAAGAYSSGGILSSIWSLAVLVPSAAVAVRRLHDIDRGGWWVLAPLVPVVLGTVLLVAGAAWGGLFTAIGGIMVIVLLVWFCLDGTRGGNRFGPDPKAAMVAPGETIR